MSDIEKLGALYLGRVYDPETEETTSAPVLFDAKDLTTHALIVGMTGSGKTGLAAVLLEEAAIDQIPALIIDPKGDMGNLLLRFPRLRGEDFRPWVDPAEATRKGVDPDALAERTAEKWKSGLKEWGQSAKRVKRFADAAEATIYTPGSQSGIPLAVLGALSAPPESLRLDADALRERIVAAVSGLLGLVDIEADPVGSREHILLSAIFERSWRLGEDLNLERVIHTVQEPGFDKLGVMNLETFFPRQERFSLALRLNNLLASPAFASWREGEPLDIQSLLYTVDGRPRLSILSIAHLSDAERMFFVTLVLNEMVAWMRTQEGTGSLRALLYMDEVFGFFPPVANPPSKGPMLTLLKQARAFGVGVVLSTQNPADLDYKGMSNMGTWFLGRLQTERDKECVLEGLRSAAPGTYDETALEEILSSLGKRVFLMNNVHEDGPITFQTRWALSYLRGPLTRSQVADLMQSRKDAAGPPPRSSKMTARERKAAAEPRRLVVPPGIEECFLEASADDESERRVYRPSMLCAFDVRYASARYHVDHWESVSWLFPFSEGSPCFDEGESAGSGFLHSDGPEAGYGFADMEGSSLTEKKFATWKKRAAQYLYKEHPLTLWRAPSVKLVSEPGEDEGKFRVRVAHAVRENRDAALEKLRQKMAPKLARLEEKIRKAEARVEREESQVGSHRLRTAISLGATVVGALFGRKLASATNVRRAASVARQASRSSKEKDDVRRAEEDLKAARLALKELEADFADAKEAIVEAADPSTIELDVLTIRARKTDLLVRECRLAWAPWTLAQGARWSPAYRKESKSAARDE